MESGTVWKILRSFMNDRLFRWGGILIISGFSLVAIGVHFLPLGLTSPPLFVNTSSSLPAGFYRVTKVSAIKRGHVLRTCLPDSLNQIAVRRGYLRQGACPGGAAHIGKPVIAIQGDTVVVSDQATQVNSLQYLQAPVHTHDRRANELTNAMGTHVLKPGECFLLSTYSVRSYDSRYYGPVPCGIPPYYILSRHGYRTP